MTNKWNLIWNVLSEIIGNVGIFLFIHIFHFIFLQTLLPTEFCVVTFVPTKYFGNLANLWFDHFNHRFQITQTQTIFDVELGKNHQAHVLLLT